MSRKHFPQRVPPRPVTETEAPVMTAMSSRIRETLDGLASKAEHYAQATNDPRALVQQVMQLGIAAIGSSKLSPADGEQIAALMIAALTLVRGDKKPSEES